MGARIGDIEADYMLTFWNSCKLTAESPMYGVLASQGIASELSMVFGPEKGTDLSKTDLARAAEGYLKNRDSIFLISGNSRPDSETAAPPRALPSAGKSSQ